MQRPILEAYVDDYLAAQQRANVLPEVIVRNRAVLKDFLEYVFQHEGAEPEYLGGEMQEMLTRNSFAD